MAGPTYNPDVTKALELAWPGLVIGDSVDYSSHAIYKLLAKYFGQQVQNELLGVRAATVTDKSWQIQYTCGSGDAVGDPVRISGNLTVTKAKSDNATDAKVIGFIRFKGTLGAASVPTATTCYLQNFLLVSGLTGGTAGNNCYLTDTGGYSATAGTVSVVVGKFISTTQAILFVSSNRGVNAADVNSGAATAGTPMTADGAGGGQFGGTVPVANGGTGSTGPGVSGGIPFFNSTTSMGSSALLTNHALVVGGGAGATPKTLSAMTDGQIIVGKTSNDPQTVTPTGDWTVDNTGLSKNKSVSGVDASGTNTAGTTVPLSGGKGTGNAEPGLLAVQYPLKGASGSTVHTNSANSYPVVSTIFTAFGTTSVTANGGSPVTGTLIPATVVGTKNIEGGLLRVGRTIRIKAMGRYTSDGTPGNWTIFATLGGVTLATTTNGTFTSQTNQSFEIEFYISCSAYSNSGVTLQAVGVWREQNGTASTMVTPVLLANSSIDVTTTQLLDVKATLPVCAVANTIGIYLMTCEYLN